MASFEKLRTHTDVNVKVLDVEAVKVPHCGVKFVPNRVTLHYTDGTADSVTVYGNAIVQGYGLAKGWYDQSELGGAPKWVHEALETFSPNC